MIRKRSYSVWLLAGRWTEDGEGSNKELLLHKTIKKIPRHTWRSKWCLICVHKTLLWDSAKTPSAENHRRRLAADEIQMCHFSKRPLTLNREVRSSPHYVMIAWIETLFASAYLCNFSIYFLNIIQSLLFNKWFALCENVRACLHVDAVWAQTGNMREPVLLSAIHQHVNQNYGWIVVGAIWESARVLCNQWTLIIPVKVCCSLLCLSVYWSFCHYFLAVIGLSTSLLSRSLCSSVLH